MKELQNQTELLTALFVAILDKNIENVKKFCSPELLRLSFRRGSYSDITVLFCSMTSSTEIFKFILQEYLTLGIHDFKQYFFMKSTIDGVKYTLLDYLFYSCDPLKRYSGETRNHLTAGRFDIITAEPITIIKIFKSESLILSKDSQTRSLDDPFLLVKKYLQEMGTIDDSSYSNFPFTIGALGYFSYDLMRRLEKIPNETIADINLPLGVIGFYEWSIVVDHQLKQTWLICRDEIHAQQIKNILQQPAPKYSDFKLNKLFQADTSRSEYEHAFLKLKSHIKQGDCYQANLCQRFASQFSGSSWQAYKILRQKNPAPFASYINLANASILSLSPERFLKSKDGLVETKPIKGTAPRFQDAQQDYLSALKLQNSEKDKAENLMIVDLLRNDLGKCCQTGSIQVPQLFALESFSNVHHLVSTITGRLEKNIHPIDLLKSCFPGGSITGAPKIRAMTIIENLEKYHRSIYCGSIFCCDIRGQMDSNIVIRTLICDNENIFCYSGGAIVYDSDAELEYQETLVKIGKLINILEQL